MKMNIPVSEQAVRPAQGWTLPPIVNGNRKAVEAYRTLRSQRIRKRRGFALSEFERFPVGDVSYEVIYHLDDRMLTGEEALHVMAREGITLHRQPAHLPFEPTDPLRLSPMARMHSAFLQFEAAQAAYRQEVFSIEVAGGRTPAGRLELRIRGEEHRVAFPEIHLRLGPQAEMHLTLHAETPSKGALIGRSVTEVGDHAHLTLVTWHEAPGDSLQWFNHRLTAHRDSRVLWMNVMDGNGAVEVHNQSFLAAPGAEVLMRGLSIGLNRARALIFYTQEHLAGQNHSDLLYKSVLDDQSSVFYDGLIRIHEAAQQANAYQKHNNLMLSPKARTDTVPNLEIMANDVRCTHGATVGRVDQDQLYYLMTRGLSRDTAERLLIIGFCQEILEDMPAFARETLEKRVASLG